MMLKKIRYIIVSLIAIFITVGAVNAAGVFYFDSASNQFVLEGNLKILEPGSFRLLLRELNSSYDSDLYINGKKDVQVRFGYDGTQASKFQVNNGDNAEVLNINGDGDFSQFKVGTNLNSPSTTGVILNGDGKVVIGSSSSIMGSGTLTVQAGTVGQKMILNADSVQFPQADGSGNNIYFRNGAIGNIERINATNITATNLNPAGGVVNISGNLQMYDPASITWLGANNVINTAIMTHSSAGFAWMTWEPVARMRIDASGDLYIAGDLFSSASGSVKKFNRSTKIFE